MIIVLAFGLAALLLWGIAIAFFLRARPGAGAIAVEGEIVGFREYLDRGRTMYVAELRALAPDGRELRASGGMATSWKPVVGKRVALLYQPNDAEAPLIQKGIAPYVPAMLAAGFAVLLSGFVVVAGLAIAQAPDDASPAHGRGTHGARSR